ncbi:hypothetical protein ACFL18_02800, partial [Patescibacteria group bacterium]
GGSVEGTFSGGGGGTGYSMQYGGRFSGHFTGGWSGTFSGNFSGWVNITYNNPATGENEMKNYNVAGPWHGSISLDGTGRATFDNQAAGGESGTATFSFPKSAFEREYGESLVKEKAKEAVEEYEKYEAEEVKKDQKEVQVVNTTKKDMPEGWEEEFLKTREQERHTAREAWFRERYLEDDYYAQKTGRSGSSFFFSHNFVNAMEPAERTNDKIVLNAIKVLNAIEEEFMKAFGDIIPSKEST